MSTTYFNTLIQIAEDSPTDHSAVPDLSNQSVAGQQFEMIHEHPYAFTSDDVIFARVAEKQSIPLSDIPSAQRRYFETGRACLRTSPLAKTYGWGIHANNDGALALVAAESDEYQRLSNDDSVKKLRAMRRSRR